MRKDLKFVRQNRTAALVAAVAIVSIGPPLQAQSADTLSISGVVKNASGEAVAGALVKVRNEASGLGFVVVSQEQGRYTTTNLLPGKYMVQGFGGSIQSEAVGPV